FGFAIAGFADGTHVEHVKAIDRAGNVSTVDVTFTLDTGNPTITLASPPSGIATNHNINIAGQVADDRSGVARLQVSIDQGAFADVAFDANSGQFTYATTQDLSNQQADGGHTAQFKVTDVAGNSALA